MTAHLSLPARLDLPAAAPLAGDLLSRRGAPLALAAEAVSLVGTPGLQVLLAARRTWQTDGIALTICEPSSAFTEQLELFGLVPADLETTPRES